jgi:hypothetical protein
MARLVRTSRYKHSRIFGYVDRASERQGRRIRCRDDCRARGAKQNSQSDARGRYFHFGSKSIIK